MRITRLGAALLLTFGLDFVVVERADAQLGAIRRKAEEAKKKLDDAAKKSAADSAAKAKASPDSSKAKAADTTQKASGGTVAPAATAKADPKVWENYDFVPGNKVLFYTDFSEDRVGNAAARAEVQEWSG